MEYPIICILGKRGSGKTTLATDLAIDYANEGIKVVANYHLFGIKYTYMSFDEIINGLEDLYDCVLMLDEAHVGADAYQFFRKNTKALTDFVTQIRKRHITMYLTTQVFTSLAKRLREQVNYIIECYPTSSKGWFRYKCFSYETRYEVEYLWDIVVDMTHTHKHFNTDEIISSI